MALIGLVVLLVLALVGVAMFTIPNGSSNADLQAQPDSVDFQILAQGLSGDGVATSTDLAVTQRGAGANMSVDVAAGVATIGTTTTATIAATNVAVTANSSGNPRFDLVCVDNTGAVSVVAGTASATPVFPAIPANSLVLAAVYVPTGASSITTARITDKRAQRSSRAWTVVTVTGAYSAKDHEMVLADATGGSFSVAVPHQLGAECIVVDIGGEGGGFTVTLTATGGVDGGTEILANSYAARWTRGDGSAAHVVAERVPFGSPSRLGPPSSAGTAWRKPRVDHIHDTKILRNVQSGTSYTLVLTDADNKCVECDNAGAFTLTIPPSSSVVWEDGTSIEWYQKGAGQITIVAGVGVTLRARNGSKSGGQFASGGLRYRGNDEWILSGDTTT